MNGGPVSEPLQPAAAAAPRPARHALLLATVALLPLSYTPHELARTTMSPAYLVLVLVIALGIRYRVHRQPWSGVDVVVGLLLLWFLCRLLLLAPLAGEPLDDGVVARETANLVAGLTMFRIARREDLRPAIVRGFLVALAVILAVEAYQLVIGLPRLLELGYQSPGFRYHTIDGAYRPFSTFNSPTVFGAYLAVIGSFLAFAAPRRWRLPVVIAVVAGLVATDTRAAWIAFAVGCGAVFVAAHRERRVVVALYGTLAAWALATATVAGVPAVVSAFERLATVADADFASNADRVAVWAGVWSATTDGLHLLLGYGAADFRDTLHPFIGSYADQGHAHNNYLQVLYLFGAIGVVGFLALLWTWWRQLRPGDAAASARNAGAKASLLAFAVGSCFEMTWSGFGFMLSVFLVVGLGSSAASSAPDRIGPTGPAREVSTCSRRPSLLGREAR